MTYLKLAPLVQFLVQMKTGEFFIGFHEPLYFYNPGVSKEEMRKIQFDDFLENQSFKLRTGKILYHNYQ